MLKKLGYIILVIVAVVAFGLVVRFIWGGPEDSWICQNGVWTKHGNPNAAAPTTGCGNQNGNQAEKITYSNATSDNITVDLPYPGAVTGKEFSVMGKARGTWYFEASFPVQVLDKDGNVLFATPAQAQEDWMTENFVPFKADIKVPESYIGPATLILKKDNPSGLPQNEASVSFPITIEY